MKIHLVDGTYELFRHYFGAPSRKGTDGREVGATVGLLRSLFMLISTPGVTHVACAFDHVIESFRNDLFPGYKTGAGVAADLLAQFPLAERAVAALGIVVWPMVELEADDALATAASRFRDQPGVERVVGELAGGVHESKKENARGWSAVLSPQITQIEEDYTDKMVLIYQVSGSPKWGIQYNS